MIDNEAMRTPFVRTRMLRGRGRKFWPRGRVLALDQRT